jgi:hypothetical protein
VVAEIDEKDLSDEGAAIPPGRVTKVLRRIIPSGAELHRKVPTGK